MMIINELNSSNSCQVPEGNGIVKQEVDDVEMNYGDQNVGDYSNESNEGGGEVAAENASNSNSPAGEYHNDLGFDNKGQENGNEAGNFNAYGENPFVEYGNSNENSNEPPELQNATLEASESLESGNDVSSFYSEINGPHISSALEAALLNCTGQSLGGTSGLGSYTAVVRTPNTQHLITASEMSTMKVSDLNDIKSIVLPHNKGNSNMKREWRNVGWFTSDEEMDRVRKSQRVSKWKTVDQINGLKVFFRCNKWKRTNCNYRMYVMYYAMDRISLNESGEHDHSTLNADFKPRPYIKNPCKLLGARAVIEATPSSSQQHALDQFILKSSQAFLNSNYEPENSFESKMYDNEPARGHSRPPSRIIGSSGEIVNGSFNLSDGPNIGELLRVASDMDLTFSFNSRQHCEYCFESNAPTMKGKTIVFIDLGDRVAVTERHHGLDQLTEEWRKADWKQFLWAVRGKCMNALKNI